ncbi:MAG: hypothetical protein M1822_009482 [Bathelium mastoideum]|nr:MAG: hypothetical protein M1822_009482 [Bathelium mastoideum]
MDYTSDHRISIRGDTVPDDELHHSSSHSASTAHSGAWVIDSSSTPRDATVGIGDGYGYKEPPEIQYSNSLESFQLRGQLTVPGPIATVFVDDIPEHMTGQKLRSVFEVFGEVIFIRAPPGKGYGFITFSRHEAAELAAKSLKNFSVNDSRLPARWMEILFQTPTENQDAEFLPNAPKDFPHQKKTDSIELPVKQRPGGPTLDSERPVDRSTNLHTLRSTVEHATMGSRDVTIEMTIYWSLFKFVENGFDSAMGIANIFVLIGALDAPQGLTCKDYMTARWPKIAEFLLDQVQIGIQEMRKHEVSLHNKRYVLRESSILAAHGLTLVLNEFLWSSTGSEKERVSLSVQGTIELALDFAEGIAWLAAALGSDATTVSDFNVSDVVVPNVRTKRSGYVELRCWPCYNEPIPTQKQCWHDMFRTASIVNCLKVKVDYGLENPDQSECSGMSDRPGPQQSENGSDPIGRGLELPFDGFSHMVALTGADTLVEHNGGLVLLGLHAILVPCQWLSDDCLQWHLIWSQARDSMISLDTINENGLTKDRDVELFISEGKILGARKHFIGLWEDAVIALGTEDYPYKPVSQDQFKEHKYDKVPGSLQISSGLSHIGLLSASKTYGYARTQVSRDPGSQDSATILEFFGREAIIIYESHSQRAWLVPKLSVVLHAIHLYLRFREQGPLDILRYADLQADGVLAAWKILQPTEDYSTIRGLKDHSEVNKQLLETLLRTIASNMRRMVPRASSSRLWSPVKGYDWADLCSKPTLRLVQHMSEWNPTRTGWWCLTEKVPLLICSDLASPVRPSNADASFTAPAEFQADHLLSPMNCLKLVSGSSIEELGNGRISRGIYLDIPHAPFGECHCEHCSRSQDLHLHLARIQYIIDNEQAVRKWATLRYYRNAAILIAPHGKKLQKNLNQLSLIARSWAMSSSDDRAALIMPRDSARIPQTQAQRTRSLDDLLTICGHAIKVAQDEVIQEPQDKSGLLHKQEHGRDYKGKRKLLEVPREEVLLHESMEEEQ